MWDVCVFQVLTHVSMEGPASTLLGPSPVSVKLVMWDPAVSETSTSVHPIPAKTTQYALTKLDNTSVSVNQVDYVCICSKHLVSLFFIRHNRSEYRNKLQKCIQFCQFKLKSTQMVIITI